MKWVLTLIAHSTCHRSSGALRKRCVGDPSFAFRHLGLAPNIIAPGVQELPARCPRYPSQIEAEELADSSAVARVEGRIRCRKLAKNPLGVFGFQVNHRQPSPEWLTRYEPHRLDRDAQAPTGLYVLLLLLAPSVRKLLQKPPGLFLLR